MEEYLYLIRNKEGVREKKEEGGKGLKGIIKVGGVAGGICCLWQHSRKEKTR